jgi:putative Holliday junction resolvase
MELRWKSVTEREEEVIVLTDEEGHEHQFEVIDVLKVDEKDYAVLFPVDESEEGDEVLILRIDSDENGEDVLVEIEDEEEFDRVAEAWDEYVDEQDWEEQAEELDEDDEDEEGEKDEK